MMLPRCCIESLALKGLATFFELAVEGDEYECDRCGTVLVLKGDYWTVKEARANA
jgi:hypothetical protein